MYINHYWDKIIHSRSRYIQTCSCLITRSSSRDRWLGLESGGAELIRMSRFLSWSSQFFLPIGLQICLQPLRLRKILLDFEPVASKIIRESVVALATHIYSSQPPRLTCTSWFYQPPAFLSKSVHTCKCWPKLSVYHTLNWFIQPESMRGSLHINLKFHQWSWKGVFSLHTSRCRSSLRTACNHIRPGVALSAQHLLPTRGLLLRWCDIEYGRYSLNPARSLL